MERVQTPPGAWYGMFVLGYKMHFTPSPAQPAPRCPPRDQHPSYPAPSPLPQPALSLLGAGEQRRELPGMTPFLPERGGTRTWSSCPGCRSPPLPSLCSPLNADNSSGAPQPPCHPWPFLLLLLPASCGQGMRAQLGMGICVPGPAALCPHRQAGAMGTAGVARGQALRNVVFSIPVSVKVVNQHCKRLLFSPARCRVLCLPAPASPAGARMRPYLLTLPGALSRDRSHPGDLSCQRG